MGKEEKAIDGIIKDFSASDNTIVLDAIKRNRKYGNDKSFKALLNLLRDTDEPQVETAIIEFLFDLKEQSSADILIQAIQDDEMSYYHNFLVSSFWQAAIDGSDYLEVFVKAAIEGDYMVTLEALTVIENFDAAYNEHDLLDLETDLQEAAEKEENPDKKQLLVSLGDVVRNLPIEGE